MTAFAAKGQETRKNRENQSDILPGREIVTGEYSKTNNKTENGKENDFLVEVF